MQVMRESPGYRENSEKGAQGNPDNGKANRDLNVENQRDLYL
jgi:hypothetical protein